MRLVIALGGNALARRGEPISAEVQRSSTRRAVTALVPLISAANQVVITHGNGPQVGMLALQAAAGPKDGAYPLDILGAESEGLIGYLIEQELRNALPTSNLTAVILTQTLVDAADPAFTQPTKPVGPVYSRQDAERLAKERGWHVAPDGQHYRRVVASPAPKSILEAGVIALLVNHGVTVICAGGGGIPVVEVRDGVLLGIEAVIDKDAASALLARNLNADRLILLTDVDAAYLDWGKPEARAIKRARPSMLDLKTFPAGSMRPKIEAAMDFATRTGKPASIGALENVVTVLAGTSGTTIDTACLLLELYPAGVIAHPHLRLSATD